LLIPDEDDATPATLLIPSDISPRMISLARVIDHLPNDQEYIITLDKGEHKWRAVIHEVEKTIDLFK
jgi:hypothetical protein